MVANIRARERRHLRIEVECEWHMIVVGRSWLYEGRGIRGEREPFPVSRVPQGSEVPLVMGDMGGSTKAPPPVPRQGSRVQASPPRVACHRRSVSGGGSRVSGPAHPTGAGRLDA